MRAGTTLKKGWRPGAPQQETCGYLRSGRQRDPYLFRWWVLGAYRTTHMRSASPQLLKFQTMRDKLTTDG